MQDDNGLPENLLMGAEADSAEDFCDYLLGKEMVYEAQVLNPTAVLSVEKVDKATETKVFSSARERGWVVGSIVPRESGDVITFVRAENGGDV